MRHISLQICTKLSQNRLKTSLLIAFIAFVTTTAIEYLFIREFLTNITLGLGTGLCAFAIVYIFHYLIFNYFKNHHLKLALLISFPIVYFTFLICAFASVTSLIKLTLFQVPFINQIYLQIWAFLGDAFIYASFSPKTPLILTCILVILSFYCAIRHSNSQPNQD